MELLHAPPLWAELRTAALHLDNGTTAEVLPVTIDADGRPDADTRTRIAAACARLAPRKPWHPQPTLTCALPARGVSVRRVRIPATGRDELARVLRLQVEAEFPLPPDELAWGWFTPGNPGSGGSLDVPVVALRKDLVAGWAAAFTEAGFEPIFTLGSVARHAARLARRENFLALDLAPLGAELASFQTGLATSVRVLPWDPEQLAATVTGAPVNAGPDADRLWDSLSAGQAGPARQEAFRQALEVALAPVVAAAKALPVLTTVVVSGSGPLARLVARELEGRLAPVPITTPTDLTAPAGRTPATQALSADTAPPLPLRLDLEPAANPVATPRSQGVPWTWIARAAVLLLALLLFPYLQAYVGRPILKKRLAALEQDRARLGEIDRRLGFLDHLTANQPPYLDAAYVIANAAPPGARVESLTLNRRGEVSFSGYVQQPPQAVEFRSRLSASKFFSSVVMEEQAPLVGGQQRVNFRITAQWKGPAERESLKLGPDLPDPPKTNAPAGTNAAGTGTPMATQPPTPAARPN